MAGHLISVDELRAMGALDVPPEWRKSLGPGPEPKRKPERDLFSDLVDEDDAPAVDEPSDPHESECDEA